MPREESSPTNGTAEARSLRAKMAEQRLRPFMNRDPIAKAQVMDHDKSASPTGKLKTRPPNVEKGDAIDWPIEWRDDRPYRRVRRRDRQPGAKYRDVQATPRQGLERDAQGQRDQTIQGAETIFLMSLPSTRQAAQTRGEGRKPDALQHEPA